MSSISNKTIIGTLISIIDGSYVPKRRCRFICKITRGIVKTVGTAVGGAVGTAISNAADAIAFRSTIEDYTTNLSEFEQQALENWATNNFIPFYEKLAQKASQIEVVTSLQEQVNIINELEAQFALALANLEPELDTIAFRLSAEAQQEKYDFAEDSFAIIQEVYAEVIAQIPDVSLDTTEVFLDDYDFTPLITDLYVETSTNATSIKLSDNSFNDESLPVDTTTEVIEDTNTTENTATEPKKYSTLKKVCAGFLLGVGISKLIK